MSDTTGPGPLTLVLRAVFVPDGEEPPPDLAATLTPLRLRATLDRETGVLTLENTGPGLMPDLRAEWRPDPAGDQGGMGTDDGDDEEDAGPG